MAGGDIAPVEPAVEAPAEVSGWEFGGQAVVYYQTDDAGLSGDFSDDDLFSQGASAASAGIQLRATNSDLVAGIGAGVELSGLATLSLEEDVVSSVMQGAGIDEVFRGGWVSQSYLTYGVNNTSFKVGRQELPAGLSPFAHSEGWNVFKNTYDAALIVNTDLPDTVLVGAWVKSANQNGYALKPNMTYSSMILGASSSEGMPMTGVMSDFVDVNDANGENGIFMLTAQNKSIENLTLTGSWYFGNEFITDNNLNILWGDANYAMNNFNIAVQGGAVMHDDIDNTKAFGAMVSGKFDMFHAALAYSTVNDSDFGVFNLGGEQTPLYTQMRFNEFAISNDTDTYVVKGGLSALGGEITAGYGYTDAGSDEFSEFDLDYTTTVAGIDLTAAYSYVDADDIIGEEVNVVRLIGRYNF